MDIILTKEQQEIHDSVIEWYRNGTKQVLTLGGLAGTGKTTLVKYITETLKKEFKFLPIAFVTFTGKASVVLKNKLDDRITDYIGTIHSFIYQPILNEYREVVGWSKKDKDKIGVELIVIDEASMVNKEIYQDLKSYNIPILAVGDHGQLPPIGKDNFSLIENPELRLTEIHRQALESPIIKLSLYVRKNGFIPVQIFGKTAAKFDWFDKRAKKILEMYDYKTDTQILCGMNKTRAKLNTYVRRKNNFISEDNIPQIGERLICLMNNKNLGIMNGQMGFLKNIKIETKNLYTIRLMMDGEEFTTRCLTHRHAFGAIKYDAFVQELYNDKLKDGYNGIDEKVNLFDYGYAISVHKSQGSEFDRVILIDERNFYQSDEDYARWLYTGLTRAKNKLVIIENYN